MIKISKYPGDLIKFIVEVRNTGNTNRLVQASFYVGQFIGKWPVGQWFSKGDNNAGSSFVNIAPGKDSIEASIYLDAATPVTNGAGHDVQCQVFDEDGNKLDSYLDEDVLEILSPVLEGEIEIISLSYD